MTTKYLSFVVGSICLAFLIIPGRSHITHEYFLDSVAGDNYQADDSLCSIYLTVDDGPSAASNYIDSVVYAEKAMINVFLVGAYASDSLQYKKNSFIEIGNHSYTHADCHYRSYYRNAGNVLHDFEHNAAALRLTNKIARLPGRNTWRTGSRKQTDLADANNAGDSLAAAGFQLFGWDIEWGYYPGTDTVQTAVSMMHRIGRAVAGNSFYTGHLVILCHENMFERMGNRPELIRLIRMIKEKKGYRLQWLSKYPF